ncbi:MAG TPA: metallophosphoesterase family protein, partial [Promineifilum sp.]|nr:metallophosphoesterase family protein [Promineifilum sp.]
MRIAIFSDVHGNLSGLEAVLDDIEQQKPDQIVFAGDLCFLGARPAACLRLLRERRIPSVAGNTDIWLTAGGEPERLRPVFEWGVAQLTPDDLGWLGGLPFALRVSPTTRAADDLLIVHANPRNVNDIVFPSEADQITRWGTVRQPDAELEPLLGWVEAAVVAYGHLHIPGVRHWGALTLVNVSSVTMPGDEDGRAKYALLEWANGRWK